MKAKTTSKLQVLVGARNSVLSVYEAPSKGSLSGGSAVPRKGQRIVEIEVDVAFKHLKPEQVADVIKPLIKIATLVQRGPK